MGGKKSNLQTKIIYVFIVLVLGLIVGLTLAILELKKEKIKPTIIAKDERSDKEDSLGKIALIIDDFGYRNDEVSDGFLSLKVDVTFAVIPGHEHSQRFTSKASKAGFEVIIHMPMEPAPGEEKFILTTAMTSQEIENRVKRALTQLPETRGMNNHQGSIATEDERVMNVVGSVLKLHNKYFVDSRTTSNSIGNSTMKRLGVKTAKRNVFLDNEADKNTINNQIDQLIKIAKQKGSAIGVGHARPLTLQILQERIPKLEKSGFQFSFVSELVH
jgi:polysaccharide deacetylase 2 family uncharacterized protein YibQ